MVTAGDLIAFSEKKQHPDLCLLTTEIYVVLIRQSESDWLTDQSDAFSK